MSDEDIKNKIQKIESSLETKFDPILKGLMTGGRYEDYFNAYQKLENDGRNLEKEIKIIEKTLKNSGKGDHH